jgi:hypothetical protein
VHNDVLQWIHHVRCLERNWKAFVIEHDQRRAIDIDNDFEGFVKALQDARSPLGSRPSFWMVGPIIDLWVDVPASISWNDQKPCCRVHFKQVATGATLILELLDAGLAGVTLAEQSRLTAMVIITKAAYLKQTIFLLLIFKEREPGLYERFGHCHFYGGIERWKKVAPWPIPRRSIQIQ